MPRPFLLMLALALALAVEAAGPAVLAQPAQPSALDRMVAAERGFAAATRLMGVRDGFLTFFLPDALDIVRAPAGLALQRGPTALEAQPSGPVPPIVPLTWDPRWGAISAAGDLGWLTGPFEQIDPSGARPPRHGAYFSVWRRQPNGTYRVRADLGIGTPGPAPFARSFIPAPAPGRPSGSAPTLADAERAFQESAATDLVGAFRRVAAPEVRLHRDSLQPLAGLEAVVGGIGDIYAGMRWKTLHVETAESADLGFTMGSYDNGREQGGWAHIWHLDASGRWTLVFDTAFTR